MTIIILMMMMMMMEVEVGFEVAMADGVELVERKGCHRHYPFNHQHQHHHDDNGLRRSTQTTRQAEKKTYSRLIFDWIGFWLITESKEKTIEKSSWIFGPKKRFNKFLRQ